MSLTNTIFNEKHKIYCMMSFIQNTKTVRLMYTVEVRCDYPLAGKVITRSDHE